MNDLSQAATGPNFWDGGGRENNKGEEIKTGVAGWQHAKFLGGLSPQWSAR